MLVALSNVPVRPLASAIAIGRDGTKYRNFVHMTNIFSRNLYFCSALPRNYLARKDSRKIHTG
jgi:hypothetical protein